MSFINSDKKLILIKRAKHNNTYKHWFWHNGAGGIAGRQGTSKPFQTESATIPHYDDDVRNKQRGLQVGDTVFLPFKKKFGTIVEDNNDSFVVKSHDGDCYKYKKNSLNLLFVSATIAQFKKLQWADSNIYGAEQQEELDFIEKYMAYRSLFKIMKTLPYWKIGEKAMLSIHHDIFAEIYEWGGCYRKPNEELIVGKYSAPTLEASKVKGAVKGFFKKLNIHLSQASKSKEHLIKTLVILNKELCWIHPFTDGNGRTIRQLSEILAMEWGYLIEWGILESRKQKRVYHNAIRKSLAENNATDRPLERFFTKRLKKIQKKEETTQD
ncbi:MAG: Fic family protein [Neptuniibacter sp.]